MLDIRGLVISNNNLVFDEENHTYTVDENEYTSVTTFIKEFFHGFDAEAIAESKAYSYGKYADKSKQDILDMWQQKADDGTSVHKEVEDYINGELESEPSQRAKHAIKWYDEYIHNEFVIEEAAELQVYSDKYKLAGTIDYVCKHTNKTGGMFRELTLVDWKTNNGIYKSPYNDGETGTHELTNDVPDANYHHYSLQLSLYAYILEEQFDQSIYKLKLVHLQPEGYKEYEVPYRKGKVEELCEERV